jgi:hypothetical protein
MVPERDSSASAASLRKPPSGETRLRCAVPPHRKNDGPAFLKTPADASKNLFLPVRLEVRLHSRAYRDEDRFAREREWFCYSDAVKTARSKRMT